MNNEELYRKIKVLLRCQLFALSNGVELYERAIPQLRKGMTNHHYERVIRTDATSVNAFICWAETIEADSFWCEIDYKLEELINKRGTPWLTFPHPTIIEVDENEI